MAIRFFLSYARSDEELSIRLARFLRNRGADIWVDQFDIQPSQMWDRAVEHALLSSPGFLMILSPNSIRSENVMDEVAMALEERKIIIPVKIGPCSLPLRLRRIQYIDFTLDERLAMRRLTELVLSEDENELRAGSDAVATPPDEDDWVPVIGEAADAEPDDAAQSFALAARPGAAPGPVRVQPPPPSQPPPPAPPPVAPPVAAPEPKRFTLAPEAMAAMKEALARHMGPIAGHLLTSCCVNATSSEDLLSRLAVHIPNAEEADIFRRAGRAIMQRR